MVARRIDLIRIGDAGPNTIGTRLHLRPDRLLNPCRLLGSRSGFRLKIFVALWNSEFRFGLCILYHPFADAYDVAVGLPAPP
jgi:hypothetical protein